MNKTSISALVIALVAVVVAGYSFFTPAPQKLGSYTPSYVTSALYPASAITLGGLVATTSTTSTLVSLPYGGFQVGDACNVTYNNAPSNSQFGADAFVTTSTATNATVTVTLWNGSSTALILNTTSSITGSSSTIKLTCFPL